MLQFNNPTYADPDAETFLGDLSSGEVEALTLPEPDPTRLLFLPRTPRRRFPSATLPEVGSLERRAPTRITVEPLPIPKRPRRSRRRLGLLTLMMAALLALVFSTPTGKSTQDFWRAKSADARQYVETIVDELALY